ncbi:MAG: hypothetical protein QF464_14745 [Myxococcota bacterium]|nr:hypothetical protein [Myxococcota bacterium]
MSILRPMFAGIATGIGLRIGADIYAKFKAKAQDDSTPDGFNPFRKRTPASAPEPEDTVTVDATMG